MSYEDVYMKLKNSQNCSCCYRSKSGFSLDWIDWEGQKGAFCSAKNVLS